MTTSACVAATMRARRSVIGRVIAGRRAPRGSDGHTKAPWCLQAGRSRPRSRATGIPAGMMEGVQQIWLAGMGALARAQRDGPAAFNDAVTEGLKLLDRSRSGAGRLVREAIDTAQGSMQARIDSAMSQANETWDSLETHVPESCAARADADRRPHRRGSSQADAQGRRAQRERHGVVAQGGPPLVARRVSSALPGPRAGAGGAPDRRGRPGSCSICNPPPPGRASVVVDSVSARVAELESVRAGLTA